MSKTQGRLWYWITRLVAVSVLVLVFAPLAAFAAPTSQDLGSIVSIDDARSVLGIPGTSTDCQAVGPTSTITKQNAKQVGVRISGVPFMLDHVFHINRQQGADSYDYIFTPRDGQGKAIPPMKFIYRSNAGTPQASSDGIVIGATGDGFQLTTGLTSTVIAKCNGFEGSPLSKALDANDSTQGVTDLNVTGSTDIGSTTNFVDAQSGNDPFTQAVQKMREVVNDLTVSVIGAIKWAINMNDLTDTPGLVQAWSTVRDLVDGLFVIVLVALAVLTIARVDIRNYDVRAVLPLLIFAVITVNFGLLFARIMLNTAFVVGQPFLGAANRIVDGSASAIPASSDAAVSFGTAMVLLIASVILLLGLAVLLFFFIIRIIVVWILAAMSPIIFLFMVLPLTRGEATKLLQHWVRWVYMVPIAFLVLFIGSAMLSAILPQGTQPAEDPGVSAILHAIFYAGVVGAAVMLPFALGGQIMRLAGKAGKGGGKGGLGIAGALPIGGGLTLASGTRAGKAFFEQRGKAQQNRAEEQAAAAGSVLFDRLGSGGLARTVTGRDVTQGQAVTEAVVDDELKRMQAINFQDADARQVIAYDMANAAEKSRMRPDMTSEQLARADSYIGRRASAKMLAQGGWWDWNIARRYGDTGYQKLAEGDPLLQNLKRRKYSADHQFTRGDFNTTDLGISLGSADGERMRSMYPSTFEYANPNSSISQANPAASRLFREALSGGGLEGRIISYNALRQNVDTNARNQASPAKIERELAMYRHSGDRVKLNLIGGNLASKEWIPIDGGPQSRAAGEAELARLRASLGLDGKRLKD